MGITNAEKLSRTEPDELGLQEQLKEIHGEEKAKRLIEIFGDARRVIRILPVYIDSSDPEQMEALFTEFNESFASLAPRKPKETVERYLERSDFADQILMDIRMRFYQKNSDSDYFQDNQMSSEQYGPYPNPRGPHHHRKRTEDY